MGQVHTEKQNGCDEQRLAEAVPGTQFFASPLERALKVDSFVGTTISGRAIYGAVLGVCSPYRSVITGLAKRIVLVRFLAPKNAPPFIRERLSAAQISANEKTRTFQALGYDVALSLLPWSQPARLRQVINDANSDRHTTAIIVQMPIPDGLTDVLDLIDPEKDIDGLRGRLSQYPSCATAEGIMRVLKAVAPKRTIAVVGARGFVGHDVYDLLVRDGRAVMPLDRDDDLLQVRDADLIVSAVGMPSLLTSAHLHPRHLVVIDAGFTWTAMGVRGDVALSATAIPKHITPVPGGVGPIEMAILMERAIRHDVNSNLPSWELSPKVLMAPDSIELTLPVESLLNEELVRPDA